MTAVTNLNPDVTDFYLEKLEVKPERPVVRLGGDVQLFSLFEDVLEGLEHGSTLTHLTYAAHSLSHLMGLILRHKDEFWHGEANVRERMAKSTLMGILGRMATYTGQKVTWEQALNSKEDLMPATLDWNAPPPPAVVALPGITKVV